MHSYIHSSGSIIRFGGVPGLQRHACGIIRRSVHFQAVRAVDRPHRPQVCAINQHMEYSILPRQQGLSGDSPLPVRESHRKIYIGSICLLPCIFGPVFSHA